jgi:hypothetical protein
MQNQNRWSFVRLAIVHDSRNSQPDLTNPRSTFREPPDRLSEVNNPADEISCNRTSQSRPDEYGDSRLNRQTPILPIRPELTIYPKIFDATQKQPMFSRLPLTAMRTALPVTPLKRFAAN